MLHYGLHVKNWGRRVKPSRLKAMQIFVSNNRSYAGHRWSDQDVSRFRQTLAQHPTLTPATIVVHGGYLIDLAADRDVELKTGSVDGLSPDSKLAKSLAKLTSELELTTRLGLQHYVLHPGICKSTSPVIRQHAHRLAGRRIGQVCHQFSEVKILVENMTGKSKLGWTPEECGEILQAAKACGATNVGLCVDTAHLWGAGLDPETAFDAFERCCGSIDVLHLNDSAVKHGANLDRHAVPGQGQIPPHYFETWVQDPRFRDIPVIVECQADTTLLMERLVTTGSLQINT